jgi:carbon storage regulator
MLVLTRKPGEEIVIGQDIRVRVLGVSGNRVRLAFEAPLDLSIHRAEIHWAEGDPATLREPLLIPVHG